MDTRGLPKLRDRVVSLGRLRQLGFAGDSTGEERAGQRGFRDLQRVPSNFWLRTILCLHQKNHLKSGKSHVEG